MSHFRQLAVLVIIATILASTNFGCSGGGGGGGRTTSTFAIHSASVTAMPGLGDDLVSIAFNHDVRAADASQPANYLFESPIGTPIDLTGSTFVVSGSRVSITLSGTGAAAQNLAPTSSFRILASGIHDSAGAILPSGSLVAGAVEGTNAPPTLSSIAPATGPAAGGTTLTLRGTGFTAPSTITVRVGDGTATNVARVDGETITAVTPIGSSGPVDVSVATRSGTSTLPGAFTYRMTLTGLSPTEGTAGGGTRVTLTGSGFRVGVVVTFGGVPATVRSATGTSIVAVTPEHVPGIVDITVSLGGDSATLARAYRYQIAIDSIAPIEGPAGGGTLVTVTGAGYTAGNTSVSFAGQPSPGVTVLNSRTVQAITPVGPPGPADVTVTTPADSTTLPGGFRFRTTIDRVDPTSGPSAGGTFIVLSGSGFTTTSDTIVRIGGVVATGVQVLDSTTITAVTGPSVAGPANVVVQNSADTAQLTGGFSYLDPPSITGITPSRGGTAGGYDVVLTGTGYSPGMQVRFGINLATNVRVGDPQGHTATVTVPRGQLGTVDVTVATAIRSFTLPGGFTYATPFPLFDASIDQVTAALPVDVVVADVNRDGHLDAVVPTFLSGSGAFTLYLGQGNGTLDFANIVTVGNASTGPSSVAVADLDGDGNLDVVVTNQNAASFSVYTGDGLGGFSFNADYTAGQAPTSVKVADFTGDGVPDVALVNRNTGNFEIRLGLGDGTFDRRHQMSLPCGNPSSPVAIAVGDLNGDGLPDLAFVDSGTSNVAVALAISVDPFFTFPEASCYRVGNLPNSAPNAVAIGDVNADGNLDVVAANLLDDSISVLLGDGNGRLATARTFPTGPRTGSRPLGLAIGDIDGDGLADVVTTELEGDTLSFLKGDGQGGFAAPATRQVGDRPGAAAVGDFDEDGFKDAVVIGRDSNTLSILRGSARGPIAAGAVPLGTDPISATSADLDRDGAVDVLAVNQGDDTISIFRNDGTGRLSLANTLRTPPGSGPSDVIVDDFDRDGNLDVAVAGQFTSSVFVFLGTGDFQFGPPIESLLGSFPIALASADWNRDGTPDIAAALADTDTVVHLGDGTGRFYDPCPDPPPPGRCHLGAGLSPLVLRAGELTGDGLMDLVAFGPAGGGGNFVVFEGNGDGFFRRAIPNFEPIFEILGGDIADIDFDGDLDAVACGTNSRSGVPSVEVFVNDGFANFSRTLIGVEQDPRTALLSDLNGDGAPDIVLTHFGPSNVSVLLNDGSGIFPGPLYLYGASANPVRVIAADLDRSGVPEVLTVNQGTRTLSILRNRS
ncbi:MAG: VCBS repeat-containing protein [Planctomycetes bacterium]|nr:VCBS repeat-containing protein [Planctomycetota bacterium]